jgi:glycosyltransferase involved in cell wall biosynthesis
LDHILNQKVSFPYEIIVSDDCSPDATPEIMRRYLDRHPDKIRYTRTNQNETAKRNSRIGDLLARGKYVAVCEGDDFWHDPDKLQLQVNVLEENPDCVLVHSSVRNSVAVTAKAQLPTRGRHKMPAGTSYDLTIPYLRQTYGVHNCSCVFRRASLQRATTELAPLIFSTQFIHGDVPRVLGLSRLGGFYFIDRETATYQVNEESLSQSKDARKRMAIRMSGAMIRAWYARLYLHDESLANELQREYLLWLYHSSDPSASEWAGRKIAELGDDLSIVRRMLKPVARVQRAIRKRWRKRLR